MRSLVNDSDKPTRILFLFENFYTVIFAILLDFAGIICYLFMCKGSKKINLSADIQINNLENQIYN